MKKLLSLLCLILAVCFLMCACDNEALLDYSDGDGNNELITMENQKVSGDEIGITVVSVDNKDKNKVKVFKKDFTTEDFSVEFKKVKVSDFAYVTEEDRTAQYPEKITLPQYDLAAFKEIMLNAYSEKFGALPENGSVFISEPRFTTKNFTGRLVVTYTVYMSPATDNLGVGCYKEARRVVMTADLYTYEIEE